MELIDKGDNTKTILIGIWKCRWSWYSMFVVIMKHIMAVVMIMNLYSTVSTYIFKCALQAIDLRVYMLPVKSVFRLNPHFTRLNVKAAIMPYPSRTSATIVSINPHPQSPFIIITKMRGTPHRTVARGVYEMSLES